MRRRDLFRMAAVGLANRVLSAAPARIRRIDLLEQPNPMGAWPLITNSRDVIKGKNTDNKGVVFRDGAYFDNGAYIEIKSDGAYSKAGNAGLTVGFFMKPLALNFMKTENDYVHFIGKGERGKHEWAFRMYNANSERPSRISFYLFNLEGGLGTGSYVHETIIPGEWMHITGVADSQFTYIYKNGNLKDRDDYVTGAEGNAIIVPRRGNAPVRIGTRDFASFINNTQVKNLIIYRRALDADEVNELYSESIRDFGAFAKRRK